jgi:hypothetical protein
MSNGKRSAALLLAAGLLLAGCGNGSEPMKNTGGGSAETGATPAQTETPGDEAERNLPKPTPQLPEVDIDGAKVSVRHGSYCWGVNGKSVCVDMAGPKEIWESSKRPPVQAAPGAKVHVKFKEAPKEALHAERWDGGTSGPQSETLQDGTLTLPQQKGIYYYSIDGYWPQGSASYVLAVEVR